MKRAALALAAALCAPALAAAQAPAGLAAAALADTSYHWISRTGSMVRVHFLAGTYAARHQDSLVTLVRAGREQDMALLGLTSYDDSIDVFFVENRPQMEALVRQRATGFADTHHRAVFLMTNPTWRAFERHEIMHVLSTASWGDPAPPGAWILEGLAQFADGRCGGYPIDPVVVGLAGRDGYVPLDTLVTRFRALNDLTAYLEAASVVGYVYRTYGRDAVRALWRGGLDAARAATGRTAVELEHAWRDALPVRGDRPTGTELAAIRAKGCG